MRRAGRSFRCPAEAIRHPRAEPLTSIPFLVARAGTAALLLVMPMTLAAQTGPRLGKEQVGLGFLIGALIGGQFETN